MFFLLFYCYRLCTLTQRCISLDVCGGVVVLVVAGTHKYGGIAVIGSGMCGGIVVSGGACGGVLVVIVSLLQSAEKYKTVELVAVAAGVEKFLSKARPG